MQEQEKYYIKREIICEKWQPLHQCVKKLHKTCTNISGYVKISYIVTTNRQQTGGFYIISVSLMFFVDKIVNVCTPDVLC